MAATDRSTRVVVMGRSKDSNLSDLSDDILGIIAGFLRARDLIALQRCNIKLDGVSRQRELWGRLITLDFELADAPRPGSVGSFLPSSRHLHGSAFGAALNEHPYVTYKRYYAAYETKKQQHLRRSEARVLAEKVCWPCLKCTPLPSGNPKYVPHSLFSFLTKRQVFVIF